MRIKFNAVEKIGFLMVLLFVVCVATSKSQQVRASQKGTVSQLVANTEISVEYCRPSAKGRVLFGPDGIVKYKKIWMPGANEASNIKLSRDVLVNGKLLRSGRYSIWAIPRKKEWTVIFSKDWDQWHTTYTGEDQDALRLAISPEKGAHMELLSFYFPVVTPNSSKLNLHWGKTIIPFEIKLIEAR